MSNALDQLARNLAGGMSRRKALWQFITSLGVVAAFTGRKTYANDNRHRCRHFCEEQARQLFEACVEISEQCPEGSCAEITPVCFNQSSFTCFNGAYL